MSTCRILVIDDDADTCEVVQMALQGEGYAVETATDRAAAQQLISLRLPSAILIDYFMSGIDLTEFLDALPASIPVVLMTGADEGQGRARALGLRFLLAKPFTIELLTEVLRSALSDARPQSLLPKVRQDPVKSGLRAIT